MGDTGYVQVLMSTEQLGHHFFWQVWKWAWRMHTDRILSQCFTTLKTIYKLRRKRQTTVLPIHTPTFHFAV